MGDPLRPINADDNCALLMRYAILYDSAQSLHFSKQTTKLVCSVVQSQGFYCKTSFSWGLLPYQRWMGGNARKISHLFNYLYALSNISLIAIFQSPGRLQVGWKPLEMTTSNVYVDCVTLEFDWRQSELASASKFKDCVLYKTWKGSKL